MITVSLAGWVAPQVSTVTVPAPCDVHVNHTSRLWLVWQDEAGAVAVIGVAHAEMGEEVKAIVQPKDWADAGPGLEAELRDWVSSRISKVTQPRSYELVPELPRLASGKLAKHELRKIYGNPVAVV